MEPPIIGAAVSGELIGFHELETEERQRIPNFIHLASAFLGESKNNWISGEAEAFRGDSWQFFCPDPTQALSLIHI